MQDKIGKPASEAKSNGDGRGFRGRKKPRQPGARIPRPKR
jgi:hypothetical protein